MDITETQAEGYFNNNDEISAVVKDGKVFFRVLKYSRYGTVVEAQTLAVHFTDIDLLEEEN